MSRAAKRERTRRDIIDAAVQVFADRGYEGAGTRAIAARAGVTQGLITYHFTSKDDLWRAAADQVFEIMTAALTREADPTDGREVLRSYIRASAAHPEIFHFIVDAGRRDDERMRWLVDTHLRPRFAQLVALAGFEDGPEAASTYYAVVGAASLMFAVGPECRRLSGADPADPATVEAHVALLTSLFALR